MTDEEIKASVAEKAIEYGAPTRYSDLYEELPDAFRIAFEEKITIRDFGLPIVYYAHPNGCWVVIGTNELAWYDLEKVQFVSIENVKRFTPLDKENARKVQPNRMLYKFEYEQLGMCMKNGVIYTLWLHKKDEFFAFWHMMIRMWKLHPLRD